MSLWVEHSAYFGPDRRNRRGGMRLRERRREDCAGRPPCVRTALRQLRLHVIEAAGAGAPGFISRTRAVSGLARAHQEIETARILAALANAVEKAGARDVREHLYPHIDRAMNALHGEE